MAFKLQDFRSAVRDLARGHLFECEIIFPTIIGSSDMVNILVQATGTPQKTIADTGSAANFMGQPHKLAALTSFATWSATMRIDDNWDNYKKFRAWSDLVIGTETNIAAFPAQYKSTVNIFSLDVAGNRLTKWELNGAWLSQIQEVAMDYGTGAPVTCVIDFEYDYFVMSVL